MDRYTQAIEVATKIAWSYLLIPYKYGGDDFTGLDCSQLLVEIGRGVGILHRDEDLSAEGLYIRFKKYAVQKPYKGVFVFYGKPIKHTAYCIDEYHTIGAWGGNRKINTVADAEKYNAFIKVLPINSDKRIKKFVDPFRGLINAD